MHGRAVAVGGEEQRVMCSKNIMTVSKLLSIPSIL